MSGDDFSILDASAPPMSAEEERAVIARAQAGDTAAIDRLTRVWLPWVREWAYHYAPKMGEEYTAIVDGDDLLQEGAIAIFTSALYKFDLSTGYRFSTYLTQWVRQRITRARGQQMPTIRLPEHLSVTVRKVARRREELHAQLGYPPTDDEVLEFCGITPDELAKWRKGNIAQPVSLDVKTTQFDHDGRDNLNTIGDALVDERTPSVEDLALAGMHSAALWRAVDEVLAGEEWARAREALIWRYGRYDGLHRTLLEVAHIMGISRERVRQLEERGAQHLRDSARMREFRLDERSA